MEKPKSYTAEILYLVGVTSPLWVMGLWAVLDPNAEGDDLGFALLGVLGTAVFFVGTAVMIKPVSIGAKVKLTLMAVPLMFASFIALFVLLVGLGHLTQ